MLGKGENLTTAVDRSYTFNVNDGASFDENRSLFNDALIAVSWREQDVTLIARDAVPSASRPL
jgi:hypothetical protein